MVIAKTTKEKKNNENEKANILFDVEFYFINLLEEIYTLLSTNNNNLTTQKIV